MTQLRCKFGQHRVIRHTAPKWIRDPVPRRGEPPLPSQPAPRCPVRTRAVRAGPRGRQFSPSKYPQRKVAKASRSRVNSSSRACRQIASRVPVWPLSEHPASQPHRRRPHASQEGRDRPPRAASGAAAAPRRCGRRAEQPTAAFHCLTHAILPHRSCCCDSSRRPAARRSTTSRRGDGLSKTSLLSGHRCEVGVYEAVRAREEVS